MQFFTTLFALASAALVLADDVMIMKRHVNSLDKRQSFTPTTQTGSGNTCADAFGAGYVVCAPASATANQLCYNPSQGQTCCSAQWACPAGSFCYQNGACCPNGLTPEQCAAALSSSSSAGVAVTTADVNVTTSICPTSGPTTTVAATWTSTWNGTASATAPAQFTGAASMAGVERGAAAIGGVLALLAML